MNGHKMVTGTARMDGQKMLSEMPALLFAWSHPTHQVITKLKRMVSTTHQVITKLKRMVAAYVLITAESHNMVSKPTGRKRVHCDLLHGIQAWCTVITTHYHPSTLTHRPGAMPKGTSRCKQTRACIHQHMQIPSSRTIFAMHILKTCAQIIQTDNR